MTMDLVFPCVLDAREFEQGLNMFLAMDCNKGMKYKRIKRSLQSHKKRPRIRWVRTALSMCQITRSA